MQRTITSTLALSLVLISCGKQEKQAPEPVPQPAAQEIDTPPARPAPIDGGLRDHMQSHFDSIRSVEFAISNGNMEQAKAEATALANHQSSEAIEKYAEEIEAVRTAANAVVQSDSLESMAMSAAKLASQCGHCHLITSSITAFEWTQAPAANATGPERMQRHRWAMDRLWEGLVGPSQSSWEAGLAILKADPIPASVLTLKGMSEDEANEKLSALQAFATAAESANELKARTALYGDLLGTCSACHSAVQAGK